MISMKKLSSVRIAAISALLGALFGNKAVYLFEAMATALNGAA